MSFTGINVDPFFTDAQSNVQNLCWGIQQDGSDIFAMSSVSNGFSPIGFVKFDTAGAITDTTTVDPLNDGSYYYGGTPNKPLWSITQGGDLIAFVVGNRWVALNRSDLSFNTGVAVSTGVSFAFFGHRVALSQDETYAANLSTAADLDCGASIFKITGPLAASWNFKDLTAGNQPPASPADIQFDASNNLWVMCVDGSICKYSVDPSTLAITLAATVKPYTPSTTGSHKMVPRPSAADFTIWYVDGTVLNWVPGSSSFTPGSQFISTAATTGYGGAQGITFVGDRTMPTDKDTFMATTNGSPKIILTDIATQSERTLPFSLWDGAGLPTPSGISGGGVYDKENSKIWYSGASFANGLDVLDFDLGVGYSWGKLWGNWL